ncbi:hypothetical protein WN944_001200 [Citrus x changshan-huyou]|uniref:C3H1-type domain-containing protein n=1 Tax=Citrus x changshan-huyou TaxID=2935761 RepID=A0AAP0QMI0_9ROSI
MGQMERSQVETTSFCFSPHRHLKSETYRALVQILSHCYDHSQISAAQDSRPGMCGSDELVGPNAAVVDNSLAEKDKAGDEDRWFGDAQIVLDEIQDILQVEENGNLLKQELAVCDGDYETGNFDEGLGQQRMLMDELEHIMKGDVILVHEEDALVNDRQEHVDIQQIVNVESRSEAELQVDKGDSNLDVPKSFDSSVDRNMDSHASKPAEDSEERNSKLRTNSLEFENEMQQKEMEEEKLVHTNGIIGAHDHRAEDVEVEEGEISGHFEVDEVSIDMIIDNAVVSNEKKEDEEQVSKDVTDKTDFPCNEKCGGTEKFSDSTSVCLNAVDYNANGGTVELQETVRNETQCKTKIFADGTAAMAIDPNRCNSMPGVGRNKRKASRDEEGISSFSASLDDSTVQKEVVKQRVTQEQGITTKDKGDKCKFSHDTVPLTKSTKACCHFARNSCMKGDNCPFDHDLSKYPCENFVAKGFCNRGDNCFFSHKLPPKEQDPPTPSTCTPELKPSPPLHASNLLKPLNNNKVSYQNVDALSNHGKVSSFKNIEQSVAKSILKLPALAPKGISYLFLGKSSFLEASNLGQGISSPKKSDSSKFANQTAQIASDSVQTRDETPRRIPVATKGVNFLSFGNRSLEDSSGKKLANLFLNRENGAKTSLSNNFGLHEKSSSSSCGENDAEVGNATTQIFSNSVQKSNDMPKKTQPAITPRGLNFLSTGKALANNTISNNQARLRSSAGDVINRSLEESPNAPNMSQNSSANPWSLPGSSFTLGHSLDHSAQGYYRSTSNSAQRALEFATKIEPKVKINQSTAGTAVK